MNKNVISAFETDEIVNNDDILLQPCTIQQPKLIQNDWSEVGKFKFNGDIGNFIYKTLNDHSKFNLLKKLLKATWTF